MTLPTQPVTSIDIPEISLVPEEVNLRLYAGDGAKIILNFAQAGQPLPMDGGELTAQLRTNRVDTEPVAIWAVDDSNAASGQIIISLTGEQTTALMEVHAHLNLWFGWQGSWDVQWQPTDSEPITLFQGNCYCDSDVTR
jgi:hypothetical protein